ncbi:hypothetical protein [Paraburkholderia sp. MM5482-R1]
MSKIRTSSTRIADITGIIEGIAFQTKFARAVQSLVSPGSEQTRTF